MCNIKFAIVSLVVSFSSTISFSAEAFQPSLLHVPHRRNNVLFKPALSLIPTLSISKTYEHHFGLEMSSKSSTQDAPPKCPITIFANTVQKFLEIVDKNILKRLLRVVNHLPTLMSLSYFGLVSMASMMSMGPMAAAGPAQATLASVLTRVVGSTTNAQFAAMFPTLVTPAPFVFLVWPTIAALQLLTVTVSAIYPSDEEEILTQNDLSALTIANLCSTAWLISSSNAMTGSLPIGSFLILPLVPIFSGYTLRNKPQYILWAYQLFSSFTTIASILAFTVELQHGGRIPLIGKLTAEAAACVFLSLYSAVTLGVKQKSGVKRVINVFALTGILVRRIGDVMTGGSSLLASIGSLLLSVSFLGSIGCWYWSLKELFSKQTS